MRSKEYLGSLIRSPGNDVLNWMPQRFGFLDVDLPASFYQLLLDPALDLRMALGLRYARAHRDLGLDIFISTPTVKRV
jgi:hypothetical protein